nr:endonuclease domain-containing protein [Actinomycetota bacterium]
LSVLHASRPLPVRGVRIHQVRRWDRRDVVPVGIPRVRPAVAAIRAAHWAVSDRQAALYLCVPVQQRIVSPAALQAAAARIVGRRRRAFVRQVVADLADGAHSLGELDFARLCRDRGLPEPSRQVVRRGPRGTIYLDVRWEHLRLVVEIDGAQHPQGLSVADDNLRANAVALRGDTVLRIDLVGLRIYAAAFMDQVCEAHRLLAPRVA